MAGILIREVRHEDIEALLALWRATESGPSVADTPAHLRMLVDEAPDLFLAAELDGRVVGSVLGGWDLWRGHIYRLAVHPGVQRRGLAGRLVAESKRDCGRGVRCVYTPSRCRVTPLKPSGGRSLMRSRRTSP